MTMKKALATGAVCAALIAALAIPASAHGGHGCGHGGGHHSSRSTTAYPVCTVADCTTAGRHDHSGVTYCGSGSCVTNGGCYGHR